MPTALIVIDVQNDLVDALPAERRADLLDAIGALVRQARQSGTPVVYVRHNEDDGPLRVQTPPWEIAAAIAPSDGEPVVDKRFGDAFQETDLAGVLSARDAGEVVLCGMQSDFCVDATARGAVKRGYRVTVVEDAHATYGNGAKTERDIIDDLHERWRGEGITLAPRAGYTFS